MAEVLLHLKPHQAEVGGVAGYHIQGNYSFIVIVVGVQSGVEIDGAWHTHSYAHLGNEW